MAPDKRPDRATALSTYRTRDVAKLLDLSPEQTRYYVRAGLVQPQRGPRREYLFSFRDIVILRTAKGLIEAGIPIKRVHRVLSKVKKHLPEGYPITAVNIWADGREVVVQDGTEIWKPESGQAFFNFEVADLADEAQSLRRFEPVDPSRQDTMDAGDWYELAREQEDHEPELAKDSYRQALELEPGHVEANLNIGRLLHEQGQFGKAEEHYRSAFDHDPQDCTAAYNLGVVLEDLSRFDEAVEAYRQAIALEPRMKEAHFNLAGVYERLGDPKAALRHFQAYRLLAEED
jgi:tetratricopeptide (TPR) repeat protein